MKIFWSLYLLVFDMEVLQCKMTLFWLEVMINYYGISWQLISTFLIGTVWHISWVALKDLGSEKVESWCVWIPNSTLSGVVWYLNQCLVSFGWRSWRIASFKSKSSVRTSWSLFHDTICEVFVYLIHIYSTWFYGYLFSPIKIVAFLCPFQSCPSTVN